MLSVKLLNFKYFLQILMYIAGNELINVLEIPFGNGVWRVVYYAAAFEVNLNK